MGRDEGQGRQPVYRVRVPDSWIRHDPLPGDGVVDTTKALCEFILMEGPETIRIAIHNFPSKQLEERIPPEAQVARWQRQFESLEATESQVVPQAFSGYSGLFLTGVGTMQGRPTMVLAWALQLAQEHYRTLTHSIIPEIKKNEDQMRSDVTIKAVGPKGLMEKHKREIIAFARSFELIMEIPARS